MKTFFPILDWLPKYKKAYLSGDLAAGLTVGIMLIPQGMAYAMIAGLPPVYGLYAALVPNFIYALTGSSRKLAVGPVALDSLIVASGIAAMKLSGLEAHITMALFLALFVGLLQLTMGFLKMGFLANFLSRPVVNAFTSAAALVIAVSQLKYVLGLSVSTTGTMATLKALAVQMDKVNPWDIGIGLLAILIIAILKKLHKKLPAATVVVVLSILWVYFFSKQYVEITLLGTIPQGLPIVTLPSITTGVWLQALPLALTLAFISFAEAMTMAKAVEEQSQQYVTDANQELRALGLSNVVGSFFQSFPANAGLSRTAVNVNEGAKTGLSSIISAIVVALTLLFLTPYFSYLPKAVLGAIILMAVHRLIDLRYPVLLVKQQRDEFVLYSVTFLATLFIGISQGIVYGILFSLVLLVYRTSKPHMAVLGKIRGMDYFKNINRFEEEVEIHDEILMVRFDAQLFFANVPYFKKTVLKEVAKKGKPLKYVILNAEPVNYIDSTAIAQLEHLVDELSEKGITFKLAGAIGPIRDILQKSGLAQKIGVENLYVRTAEAHADSLKKIGKTPIQKKVSLEHR
ncbi:MAG: sulfate permease [Bacteroidota bacterium]